MKNPALIRFGFILLALFSFNLLMAQCPTCTPDGSGCVGGSLGELCTSSLPDATAGKAYSATMSVRFPTQVTIKASDTVPGLGQTYQDLLTVFPFPLTFPVIVNIETNQIQAVNGLPAGLSYSCDSANCTYVPPTQLVCIEVCGDVDCAETGTKNVQVAVVYNLNASDVFGAIFGGSLPPIPLPGLPSSIEQTDTFSVSMNVIPNASPTLTVTSASGGSVIDSSESETLNATPGFDSYSWSTAETTNSITVTPNSTTVYTVTATDTAGCSQTATFTLEVTTPQDTVIDTGTVSIGLISQGINELSLYPNPNSGQFTLSISVDWSQELLWNIADLSGRIVDARQLNLVTGENIIEANVDLATGIYLLQLQSDNINVTRRIIID